MKTKNYPELLIFGQEFMKIFYLLFIVAILSCCSDVPPKNSFGKIDDEYLQFSDFYRWIPQNVFEALPDSSKKKQINFYFKLRLVFKEIKTHRMDQNPELSKIIEDFKKERLGQLVTQIEIIDKVVSEDNLRKLYDELQKKRKIGSILIRFKKNERESLRTKSEAKDLIYKIYEKSHTINFDSLAMQYTEDFDGAQKKGSLGWVTKYTFDPVMDSVIWSTGVGHISKPFMAKMGYRIMKVDEETKIDSKSFKEELPNIKRLAFELWDDKFQKALNMYTNQLKEEAEFSLNGKGIEKFCAIFERTQNEKKQNPIEAIREMKQSVNLGSYNNKNINNQWLIQNLQRKNHLNNFIFMNPKNVRLLIENIVDANLLYERALKLGLNKSEEYINQLNNYKLKIYYDYYMSEYIHKNTEPNEEEIREYYERNKFSKYMTKEKLRTQIISVTSKELSEHIHSLLKSGENFNELAKIYDTRDITDNPLGYMPAFTKNEYGVLGKTAEGLKLEEISNPIKYHNNYVILKLLERIPAVPKFLNEVRKDIKKELTSEKRIELEKKAIKNLKEKYSAFIIYDKVIDTKRIKHKDDIRN